MLKTIATLLAFLGAYTAYAQTANPRIKCYFNHPVNIAVSSGVHAVYLNGTFDDTIAAYIDRAKYTVDIAQYNFTGNSSSGVKVIAVAANKAYLRGVVIRWIYNGSSGNSGLNMVNSNIQTLASPTGSGYGIMHDKFVAVDVNAPGANDPILITSSYDWSDQQTISDYNDMVVIQDRNVAKAYYDEFNKMWGGTGPAPDLNASAFGPQKTASAVNSFNVNGTTVDVWFSPKDGAGARLQNNIASADYDLHFGIYTFTDNAVANAIKNKYAAGLDGFGIMDAFSTTYSPFSTLNASMGNSLKVFDGGSTAIYHNKMMLIDALHPASDPRVVTGSCNWTLAGENTNDENMIVIHDAVIANEYYQSICRNFSDLGGVACTTTETESPVDNGLDATVYPNPFAELIHVYAAVGAGSAGLKITDHVGRLMLETTVSGAGETDVRLPDVAPGVYLVYLYRGDAFFVQKLIKQ
jgi:phosphatidylserine/phosphatidylglycerophosphate/cardiolipin synthase-like enzyme